MTSEEGRPDIPRSKRFDGRVVLVTGASGGIGAAIAREFAGAGATVGVHYRTNIDGAKACVEAICRTNGHAVALRADLTDERQCDEMMSSVTTQVGPLDVLINNAAIQPVQPLNEMEAEDWRAVLDTNTTTAFLCTRAAARAMDGRGGAIVHIASIEGLHPALGHGHYSASKAALIAHARAAALEYGPANIRVNAVSPGLIDRPGLLADWPDGVQRYRMKAPLGRWACRKMLPGPACSLRPKTPVGLPDTIW